MHGCHISIKFGRNIFYINIYVLIVLVKYKLIITDARLMKKNIYYNNFKILIYTL